MQGDLIDPHCIDQPGSVRQIVRKTAICHVKIIIVFAGILRQALRTQHARFRTAEHDRIVIIRVFPEVFALRRTRVAVRIDGLITVLDRKITRIVNLIIHRHKCRRSHKDDREKQQQPLFTFFHLIILLRTGNTGTVRPGSSA